MLVKWKVKIIKDLQVHIQCAHFGLTLISYTFSGLLLKDWFETFPKAQQHCCTFIRPDKCQWKMSDAGWTLDLGYKNLHPVKNNCIKHDNLLRPTLLFHFHIYYSFQWTVLHLQFENSTRVHISCPNMHFCLLFCCCWFIIETFRLCLSRNGPHPTT